MTESELYSAFQEEFNVTSKEARTQVEFVINTIVEEAMKGKCSFGKVGTFKATDVKAKPAKPARYNVPNPIHPGTFYDVPAKPAEPARKKLSFTLSKKGKLLGA